MIWRVIFFVLSVVFSHAAFADAPGARINDVRFGEGQAGATRVVIDADKDISFGHFTLTSGAPRIVVDMPRVRWSIEGLTSEAGHGAGQGIVARYRYEHNSAQTSRLILDLAGPAQVAKAYALDPKPGERSHRIVLDLAPVSLEKFHTAAPTPKPTTAVLRSQDTPVADQRRERRKPLVVIDAGHGGKDPGAIGIRGTQEKDVTLSATLALKAALEKTGRYEVALTRQTDTFLELEERVNRARMFQADLFISIHADAGKKRRVRGASVYTLSASGEKRARSLRKQHDWVMDVEKDNQRPTEVKDILVSLIENETKNQSARFANTLIPNIQKAGWPTVDNTHRSAGFFVLLAPDVPAVLLEMGFLTNESDEKLMTSERHRRHLLRAVVESIDEFFDGKELYVAQR